MKMASTTKTLPIHNEDTPTSNTYRHVGSAASIPRLSNRVHQLARDAKVTELDIATLI